MSKADGEATKKVENEIEIKLEEPSNIEPDKWLEEKLLQLVSKVDLNRVSNIKEQIDNHYVASVVYKELEKNLTQRSDILSNFKSKLIEASNKGKAFLEEQQVLKGKIERINNKQKECLKEYQEGAQELEEEVIQIEKQVLELEKQILEHQRRKSEIAEQQEVRLKEQDATQMELQAEVDNLENNVLELKKQHDSVEEEIKTMPAPENLVNIDSKIEDLVHHICSIFEVPVTKELTGSLAKNEQLTAPIFQLDPWATEENKGLAQISIPVGIKQLILSLHIPGDKTYEKYSAELYSSNGRRVWNSDKLEVNGRAVVITFNSTFFLSDDYEMRLKGRNSERSYTPIAEYYFHVNKK